MWKHNQDFLFRPMKYIILSISFFILFSCSEEDKKIKKNEIKETKSVAIVPLNTDEKLEDLNLKIRANINNKDLYLERADYFLENEDTKSAMQDINRAFKLDTLYLPTLLKQADFLAKSGKLVLSKAILDKADVLNPKNSLVQTGYSKLYLIGRSNEKSTQYADLAVKYDIYNAEAYYLKGYNFLEVGDTNKAISSYRTAVEQNPDYFDAYLELGLIFSSMDDPIALDYYRNALEIRPTEKRVLYSKGMFEQEHEMYNEAMATYTNALKFNPDFKEAQYNLGFVHLFYLKLYRQSQQYFTEAIKIDPRYVEAYYNRGYAFELLGDVNNAAKDYRKALEINPSYTMAAKGLSRLNN